MKGIEIMTDNELKDIIEMILRIMKNSSDLDEAISKVKDLLDDNGIREEIEDDFDYDDEDDLDDDR